MQPASDSFVQLTANSKEVARTLLTIGSNRLELLRMEVQEERVLLLQAIFLAFGAAAFGLLWGVTLTGMIVFLFFNLAPITVMTALLMLYGAAAIMIHRRLTGLLRTWRNLPSTFDQLRKDRLCLETIFK
jgi:uncharacterized membrane protein YqjE